MLIYCALRGGLHYRLTRFLVSVLEKACILLLEVEMIGDMMVLGIFLMQKYMYISRNDSFIFHFNRQDN